MKLWMLFYLIIIHLSLMVQGNIYFRIFPEGTEAVYSYKATVTTGTEVPAPFLSQFTMTGSIRLQGYQDHATLQLQNLQFSMYSGDGRIDGNVSMVDIPSEAEVLLHPFTIHYSAGKSPVDVRLMSLTLTVLIYGVMLGGSGLQSLNGAPLDVLPGTSFSTQKRNTNVSHLTVEDEDPTWSTSIKKALAGILQIDLHKFHFGKSSSFRSKEQTIHGECEVQNTIHPQADGVLITKFNTILDCQNGPVQWTNIMDTCCSQKKNYGGGKQNELLATSNNVYNAVRYKENNILIKEVVAEGKIFYLASRIFSNKHSITVSQRIILKSLNDIFKPINIQNPSNINTIQYDKSEFYSFKFSTNEDLTNIVNKVIQLVFVLVSQLEGTNQLLPQINPQQPHLVPLLITYLRKLDAKLLEDTFKEIAGRNSTPALEVFTKMLPLVGSKESSIFVVQLILQKRIGDDIAISLLAALPANIRQTSEELLGELEDLLNLPEDVSESVRNSAILSFATIIYRACGFNKCTQETAEKYPNQYLKHVKENIDDHVKQLYITGLQNMRSEKVVELLKPIILGDETIGGKAIRVSSLKAVFPVITCNTEKLFELYWPVISKRDNDMELRLTALEMFMKAELTQSSLLQLHWFMIGEQHSYIYSMYYVLLNNYAEHRSDCYNPSANIFHQILSIAPKPDLARERVFYHQIFHISEEVEVTVSTQEIGSVNSVLVSFTSKTIKHQIILKVQGLNKEVLKLFIRVLTDSEQVEEIIAMIKTNSATSVPLHIEYTVNSHDQAVATRYYDITNINELFKVVTDMKNLFTLETIAKFSYYHIDSFFNMERFFVTDIGMPGVLSEDFPTLSSFRSDINAEASKASVDIRYWSQGSTVLKVKNTIANIWQGIIKSHVTRFTFPFGLYLNSSKRDGMKLAVIPSAEPAGCKWQTTADIFTVTYNDKYDALSESCKLCQTLSAIINHKAGNDKLEKQRGIYTFKTESFECEIDESKTLKEFMKNVFSSDFLYGVGLFLSAGYFLEKNLLKLPITGSCGLAAIYTPNQTYLGPKMFIDFEINSATATLNGLQRKSSTRIIVNYGNTSSSDNNCNFNDACIKVAVDEVLSLDGGISRSAHNIYQTDQCDQNLEISTCAIPETKHDFAGELKRISASFTQIPDEILQQLKDILKTYSQPTFYKNIFTEVGDPEVTIIKNGRQYYLNLIIPSESLALKNVSIDVHPDVIQFLYDLCKYLMNR